MVTDVLDTVGVCTENGVVGSVLKSWTHERARLDVVGTCTLFVADVEVRRRAGASSPVVAAWRSAALWRIDSSLFSSDVSCAGRRTAVVRNGDTKTAVNIGSQK